MVRKKKEEGTSRRGIRRKTTLANYGKMSRKRMVNREE